MAQHTTTDDFSIVESESTDPNAIEEAKIIKNLVTEYKAARSFDEDARKQYLEDRRMASGRSTKNWASDANLIGTFIDILVSFLYARDPDISALPAAVVGDTSKDAVDFAKTITIVVSRLWKKGRLKKAARKVVRSGLSVGPGWLKAIMTHETRKDPVVQAKLNDLEDNAQRLKTKQIELQEGDLDEDEITVKLNEVNLLRTSLQAKLEIPYRYGLAIDFVQAEDMQVSLDVADITDYLDADWNANEIYIRITDLRRRFPRLTKEDVERAAIFHQRKIKKTKNSSGYSNKVSVRYERTTQSGGLGDDVTFARVVELWDNRDNHVKTFIDGVARWAVEPYPPPYASSRFYPYFNFSPFEVDGERHPQSLSDRLTKLQEEYSSKRSNSRLAAERSVPGVIFDRAGITPEDMTKIQESVHQEFVGINPTKGDDLRKLFAEKPIGKADPLIYSTEPTLRDMERVSGVQEALSSAVSVKKTATEAKIQDSGFASRTNADRDSLEDMLRELAEYTTELSIQALPVAFVQRMAGPQAFWPEGMDIEDLVTLAELDIEAGTTGKPNDEKLRQSWATLLPLVQAIMVQIQQAQFMGNLPLAEAMTNLLRETMRRLDERINIDQFIPQGELPNLAGAPGVPGAEPAPAPAEPNNAADANTLV